MVLFTQSPLIEVSQRQVDGDFGWLVRILVAELAGKLAGQVWNNGLLWVVAPVIHSYPAMTMPYV